MKTPQEYNDFDKALRSKMEGFTFDFEQDAQDKFFDTYGREAILPNESFLTTLRKSLPLLVLLMMVIVGLSLWVKDSIDNRRLHSVPKVESIQLMADNGKTPSTEKTIPALKSPLGKVVTQAETTEEVLTEAQEVLAANNIEPKKSKALLASKASKSINNDKTTSQSIPSTNISRPKAIYASVNHNDQGISDQASKPLKESKSSFDGFVAQEENVVEKLITQDILNLDYLAANEISLFDVAIDKPTIEEDLKFANYASNKHLLKRFSYGISGNYFNTKTSAVASLSPSLSDEQSNRKAAFIAQDNNTISDGYEIGINTFFSINNFIRLRTGLAYNESNYMYARSRIDYGNFAELDTQANVFTEVADVKQRSLKIPLGVDFMFKPKRLNIACYAGSLVSYSTLLGSLRNPDQALITQEYHNATTVEQVLNRKIAYQVHAGIEFPIGNKLTLSVEPNVGFNSKRFIVSSNESTIKTLMESGIAMRLMF